MTVEIFESTPVGGVWTAPLGVTSVQYLVVGGGGSGGDQYGGGGGAGGAVGGELSVTPGSSYTLLVGAGGNDSQFDTKIGYAGGAGGSGVSGKGANGGCGGGGGVAGKGTGSQGYGGGSNNSFYGGGGGGMGAAGGNAGVSGGAGGGGISSSISGSAVWYAGGGGGGANAGEAAGGAGGGGAGGNKDRPNGGANTGGGGGGAYTSGGGKGGSGVVVLNYTINTPAAPTDVEATQNNSSKVTITWTKNPNASAYRVLRDGSVIATLGDVATYDDSTAAAPAITPGTASASDGTIQDYVALNLSGASIANGTAYSYTVQGYNSAGWGTVSSAATGYRKANSLTYQWLRSAADSDASYSEIPGATTASYNDTAAPGDGSGRYFKCALSSTGATSQTSTADRGCRFTTAGLFTFLG